MSLLGALTPSETPQAGVKRPLQGKPTNVPNNLPAFRGRSVAPGGNVKVPKLSQGNRPNEGTNIPIPYNRVCPLEFLSGWTGRLAPGDVAFILKYPPGFLSKAFSGASAANNATNGTGTMSRVIGLDGLNRMLHGSGNANGWRLGENVLMLNDPNEPAPGVVAATSPLDLKVKIMSFGAYAKVPDTPPGPNDDLLDYARYVPDVALRTDVTAARAPTTVAISLLGVAKGQRKTCGDLLGLRKVSLGTGGQRSAGDRRDALVGRHVLALVNQDCKIPIPNLLKSTCINIKCLGIIARIGANACGLTIICRSIIIRRNQAYPTTATHLKR